MSSNLLSTVAILAFALDNKMTSPFFGTPQVIGLQGNVELETLLDTKSTFPNTLDNLGFGITLNKFLETSELIFQ